MIIVAKGKEMFTLCRRIPLCTFRILLRWCDSGVAEVGQRCDRGTTVARQSYVCGTTVGHQLIQRLSKAAPAAGITPTSFSIAPSGLLGTHVPVPVNTLSLRKENSVQDATISLMNRGSRAVWGTSNSMIAVGEGGKPALSKNMPWAMHPAHNPSDDGAMRMRARMRNLVGIADMV